MTETTFAKYQGHRALNYCTNPTKDVEILAPVRRHCQECGGELVYEPTKGSFGGWIHANRPATLPQHYVTPRTFCSYCGTDEPGLVLFTFESYYDRTACSRCGGIYGRPIGD